MSRSLEVAAIGVVRSAHTRRADTPVQSSLNPDEHAQVQLHPEYAAGLAGLAGFDRMWLITWLGDDDHQPGVADLIQTPFLATTERRHVGVFAMRGPRRPNPLGLSLVRIDAVEGNVVHFSGVDVIDGTLVLDLKPYVTRFDQPGGDVRCGWFDEVAMPHAATPSSLRTSATGVDPERPTSRQA